MAAAFLLAAGYAAQAQSGSSALFLSLLSGTYRADQGLVMEALEPGARMTYALEKPDGTRFTSLGYREPLALTALHGEEREYRLSVQLWKDGEVRDARDLAIRIDRRAPEAPVAEPPGGAYDGLLRVSFRAPPDGEVYFALNQDILTQAVEWDGRPLSVDADRGDQVLQYFAMDDAGNRSDVATELYTRRPRERQLAPRLEIVSPAEGTFSNQQLLYLISEDVGTIRYTLDGTDPARYGSVYSEPRLLGYSGRLELRVAAFPVGSERNPLLVERVFEVVPEQEQSLVVSTPSGVFPDDRVVEVLGEQGVVFYTTSEVTPDDQSLVYRRPLLLASTAGSRRVSVLRVRLMRSDGTLGGEYRYCYVFDRRTPPAPTIEMEGSQPARAAVTVRIDKDPSATVRYSLDGSDPGPASTIYTGPFRLEPASTGEVRLKAVAVDARGAASPVVSRLVTFDTRAPDAPRVRASELAARRAVRITIEAEAGATIVREVADRAEDLRMPTAASPTAERTFTLDVPVGYRREFHLRFAAVDAAGNISTPTDPLRVLIDKEPPECPASVRSLDEALLDAPLSLAAPPGLPELRYEVRSDGSVPPDPTLSSTLFGSEAGGTLTLAGRAGEGTRYSFTVLLRDELGNTSDSYGPFSFTIDRRKPALPRIEGVEAGQRVNAPTVTLRAVGTETTGVRVAYTYSADGSTPEAPSPSSPALSDPLELKGVEGQEVPYTFLLLPISSSGNLVGDPVPLAFVIDRKPPSLPAVRGVVEGARSAIPVVVTLVPAAPTDELYVSLAQGEAGGSAPPAPGDPVSTGRRYTDPLVFDAESGHEIRVALRVAAKDQAGNRSRGDSAVSFTVDKRAPEPVAVSGVPASGVSRDPVTITMSSVEREVFYEMTEDGSVPPPPGPASPQYISPLVLSGREGEEIVYRIRACAVDDVDNVGPAEAAQVLLIDRRAPVPPPRPSVAAIPSEAARFVLAWPDPGGSTIFYRVAGAGTSAEFRRYAGPFDVRGSAGETAVGLECFAEDAAGNRSAAVSFALSPVRRLAPPAVLGAEDGALYRSDRILVFDAPGGEIRYELTLDGTTPPAVTPSSQLATGPVELNVLDGATMDVAIRVRAFPDGGSAVASAETAFRLTIDKTPPEPPVAEGITDRGYYQGETTVRLLAVEGDIYYGLEEGAGGGGIPGAVEANRYREPILLRVGDGQIAAFRLMAYTIDEAGNRSRAVRAWNVTLDNKVVYVAENGDDRNPGTRDKPLQSIESAVRVAATSGRKEIHLALGAYTLERTLVLGESVSLIGGYLEGWEQAGLGRKSTLTAAPGFPREAPLVNVTGGSALLAGFRFTHPPEIASTLLRVGDAEARLENCAVYLTKGEDRVGLDVAGGRLTVVSSEFEADDGPSGSFIRVRSGALTLSSSTLRGPRVSSTFAAVVVQNRSSAALSGVRIDPGGAQRTDGVVVDNSDLVLARSTVESGAAGIQGAAVRCVGARIDVSESSIAGSAGGVYTFALSADASTVSVRGSRLVIAGRAGATGIKARGGEVRLERNELRAADSREFSYLADLAGARSSVFTNVMVGARSGDSVVAVLEGGTSDWFNNTIVAGTGSGLTTGFYVTGSGTLRIINNILLRREADAGTAIVRIGEGLAGITLAANNLSGWSYLLSADAGSGRTGRLAGGGATRIATIEELEASDGDRSGGPLRANVKESHLRTFRVSKQEDFHLAGSSQCVNKGITVSAPEYGGPTVDMDGEGRPAPLVGTSPAYDIGADELY